MFSNKSKVHSPQSTVVLCKSYRLAQPIFYFLLSAFCFISCSPKPNSENRTSASSTKFDQYYLQGQQLYQLHCSNCHQKDGSGLGLLYPPLNKSDFMDNNFEKVICLMTNGISGELIVNGKSYNKHMPGVASLTDLEVAEIATYIYNTWENSKGIIDVSVIQDNHIVCSESN
jgi:cytochrome c551